MENCGKLFWPGTVRGYREPSCETARGAIAAVRACSACAGDYEDPDRTAWAPEDGAEEKEGNAPENPDEFSAEE